MNPLALAGTALLMFAFAESSSPPAPSPTATSQGQQEVGRNESPQSTPSDTVSETAASSVDQPPPKPTAQTRETASGKSGKKSPFDYNAFAITIFTAALVVVAWFQYRITKRQVDSIRILNRARVVIDKCKFSDVYSAQADFSFHYALTNKGHTTAHVIESRDAASVIENLPEVPPDYGTVSVRHVILAPGQEVHFNFTYTKTADEMKTLSQGKGEMFAYGVIKYRDEFGSEWDTRYGMQCPRVSPFNATFITLPGYNAAS